MTSTNPETWAHPKMSANPIAAEEKKSAASEQGGWFRGGRGDRCPARPGGYGAGGHPIGEDSRSSLCQGFRCRARGHGLAGAGEAPTGRRPQSPASGVFLSSAETVRHRDRPGQRHHPPAMAPAHLLHAVPPPPHFRAEMSTEISTEVVTNGGRGRGGGRERGAARRQRRARPPGPTRRARTPGPPSIREFGRTTGRGPGPGIVCRAPGRAGCCCRASGTIRVRTAARTVRIARTDQIVANALSRMSRPSPSRSSPMTSGGRKRSTLP